MFRGWDGVPDEILNRPSTTDALAFRGWGTFLRMEEKCNALRA